MPVFISLVHHIFKSAPSKFKSTYSFISLIKIRKMLYFEAQKLTSQIGLNQLQMCELPNIDC